MGKNKEQTKVKYTMQNLKLIWGKPREIVARKTKGKDYHKTKGQSNVQSQRQTLGQKQSKSRVNPNAKP